eukprot:CAMPEP_0170262044 /NCGR_PEP_ID=MMETSP0116_2-20130129/30905_1 /TAXON_ID=400756 /ORGANISM="Durinskia baltica, Strain CSIRO CS-38" /LENGTH=262 /DNA_ID=CAMNT_0010513113 /DNA_START=75 /DNA_END=863 /DNA_ORIENTATION=-
MESSSATLHGLNDDDIKDDPLYIVDVSTDESTDSAGEEHSSGSSTDDGEVKHAGTLIIFDWDDTLCPTTHHAWGPRSATRAAMGFDEHEKAVEELLRVAASLGSVCIVSMAKTGWIEETTRLLLPRLKDVMCELDVHVSLARRIPPQSGRFDACSDGTCSSSRVLKRRAMSKLIRDFTAKNGGCNNIVGVGDSEAERQALQDAVMGRGRPEMCHCKTLKFRSEPTVGELTEQVRELTKLLPSIALHHGDIDSEIEKCGRHFL